MMVDAVAIMAGRKISELPVVDADGKPVGLIDITDVVALLPKEAARAEAVPIRRPNSAPWRDRGRTGAPGIVRNNEISHVCVTPTLTLTSIPHLP